jgi:uncharacterized protein YlaI
MAKSGAKTARKAGCILCGKPEEVPEDVVEDRKQLESQSGERHVTVFLCDECAELPKGKEIKKRLDAYRG